MSRTARRANVMNPIAVQIRVTSATMPVMPSTPALLVAISVTCAVVNRPSPSSLMRSGM